MKITQTTRNRIRGLMKDNSMSLKYSSVVAAAGAAFLLNLSTLSGQAQTNTTSQGSSRTNQIIIAFKTHFDIGYTDLAGNVIDRYRTKMIDQALEVCDQSRDLPQQQQFVWTIPGWPMKKILENWEGQTPQRHAKDHSSVQRGAIRRARLAFHHSYRAART